MECTDDDRTRINAIKGILAADKLSLEQVKIELQAEKQEKPIEHKHTHGGTITLAARIDSHAAAFEGAANRAGESALSTHGSGEPLDP